MTKKEKWIVDEDDGLRLFYGDENFNGSAYPCNDIVFMKMIADKLNKLEEKNEQLKQTNKKVIDKILDGIVEMHDGKRDYAEKLFNEAIELIQIEVNNLPK